MGLDRTRQQFGFSADMPDSAVLREAYAQSRQRRPDLTREDFVARIKKYEGAGAPAAPQATQPPPAAVAEGNRPAPAFDPYHVAKRAVEGAVGDVKALGMGLTVDPVAQMGRAIQQRKLIVEPTPEEKERAQRGLAALGGIAAGGMASRAIPAGVNLLTRALRSGSVGMAAGATDAAIRSGGDPVQAAAGAGLGTVAGPLLDEGMRWGLGAGNRNLPSLDEVRPPIPFAGIRGVNNLASPVGNRIAAQGAPGQAIRRMLQDAQDAGDIGAGQAIDDMAQAGLIDTRNTLARILRRPGGGLTAEQDRLASLVRRGHLDPSTLDAQTQRALEAAGAYFEGARTRANEAGIRVRTSGGALHEIPENPNYLPELPPALGSVKPSRVGLPKPTRARILRDLVDTGRVADDAAAKAYLDDWIKFKQSRGKRGGDVVAQRMVERGQARSVEEAKGILARDVTRPIKRASSLEYAREADTGIFDPSLKRAVPSYIDDAERRIGEAIHLGPEMEKVDAAAGMIPDQEERELVQALVKIARDTQEVGDTVWDKALRAGRQVGVTLLSPVTTVKNVGQATTNVPLRTDIQSTLYGLASSVTKAGQRRALRGGSTTPAALRQSMHGVTDMGALADAYLRAIGMTPSERWLRTVAHNAGEFYAGKQARKMMGGDQFAEEELRRLRLDPRAIRQGGGLTDIMRSKAGKVISDETQFRARPIDLPSAMTANPFTKNASQFRSFIVQQTILLKKETSDRIRDGLRSGNRAQVKRGLRNLAILGTAYPLTGEALNDVVAWMTGKERTSEGFDRYLENLVTPGGAGIANDMIEAARRGNIPEFVAGPTVGRWGKNLTTGARAIERAANDEDELLTDAEKRNLTGQVPFVGRIAANRLYPTDE